MTHSPTKLIALISNPRFMASEGRAGYRKPLPVLNDTHDSAAHEAVFKDLYLRDVAPPHPGEVLREDILPQLGLTRTSLAKRLGISRQRLGNLLAERTPINAGLAMRLGTVLGHGARYWLGLQIQHDIWVTEQAAPFTLKPFEWKRPAKAGHRKASRAPIYR